MKVEIRLPEDDSNIFAVIVYERLPSSFGSVDWMVKVSVPSQAIGVEDEVIPVSSDSS